MISRRELLVVLGAGTFAPHAAFAQPQLVKIPRIGFLGATSATGLGSRLEAFQAGLRDFGYSEGRNIFIDYRWAEDVYDRLPELAAELVRLNVDVIFTSGTVAVLAAKGATTTIPIVMVVGDALANGIVANLARPGGNITGSTYFQLEIMTKRLEFIKAVAPHATQVAFVMNLENPAATGPTLRSMQTAAKALKIELQPFGVRGPNDFGNAFAAMAKKHITAVVTNEDSTIRAHRFVITNLAVKQRLPLAGATDVADAGALIGYGPVVPELYRRAAYFVDKILKGAKPGDLPVERPTKFELVVNMKTARALSIKIPQSILVRADRVIE